MNEKKIFYLVENTGKAGKAINIMFKQWCDIEDERTSIIWKKKLKSFRTGKDKEIDFLELFWSISKDSKRYTEITAKDIYLIPQFVKDVKQSIYSKIISYPIILL